MVDSGGAFLPLQAEIFPDVKHGGRSFRNQAVMSGQGIPQVAIGKSNCWFRISPLDGAWL